jgi:superfamily II DNA or RNA helicase
VIVGNLQYHAFLDRKKAIAPPCGLGAVPGLHPDLFDFQRDIVSWALLKGRAAIFADCGMGKTPMQLEWARHVPGDVLILAPLAVAPQTVREGEKFGIPVRYCRDGSQRAGGITVTNYEMLDRFNPADFVGVVLDESSILKAYDGKTRTKIIQAFRETPYRLACTATPAPNDHMELGNHSEFLGLMTRPEMLSMFFVHDGGSTQNWRIKGHARSDFWRWVCSWAVMLRMPSDLGYEDGGFVLPPIEHHHHTLETTEPSPGHLFPMRATTLRERISARASTTERRAAVCADLVNGSGETWVIWCNLNRESGEIAKRIDGAVEIRGNESNAAKEDKLFAFANGEIRVLVTKPSIAGHGMNWQHCHKVAFLGLSDSYEQFYQAARRCWRFGQESKVDVHIITADIEGATLENIKRKEADAERMALGMIEHMKEGSMRELHLDTNNAKPYRQETAEGNGWRMVLGDCVEVMRDQPDNSIGYSIFSPPFASLYTYSDSERDMGNTKDTNEFMEHFLYLVQDIKRCTMPGRLVSFHCMNLPLMKAKDGMIGLLDFRGNLIRLFLGQGFIYHSEVCIWKDPVTQMQRTKALGLLHKQIKKDSAMCRMGIPDYLVTMRLPGDNPEPITHTNDSYPVTQWQEVASPIWTDINPNDTLTFRSAREHDDERHICPLQLEVIRRALRLWSNPGDLVLSPFAGIGSEGFVALEMGRKFLGIELKESYYREACRNMKRAEESKADLFTMTEG